MYLVTSICPGTKYRLNTYLSKEWTITIIQFLHLYLFSYFLIEIFAMISITRWVIPTLAIWSLIIYTWLRVIFKNINSYGMTPEIVLFKINVMANCYIIFQSFMNYIIKLRNTNLPWASEIISLTVEHREWYMLRHLNLV